MTIKRNESPTFDDAVAAVRDDVPQPAVAEAAAARVFAALEGDRTPVALPGGSIRGCADVRALLPAYRAGQLPETRTLLVEDHLAECAVCRAEGSGGRRLAVMPWTGAAEPKAAPVWRPQYASAATILLAAGIAGWTAWNAFYGVPAGNRAVVHAVTGALHRVGGDAVPAIGPGGELAEGESVRTARGSRAVLRLRDGSTIEMSEKAELSITMRGLEVTIHLMRGNIIVQAARRKAGALRVATSDATVEVKGTTFAVNNGLKGSRVSVIEGEVAVDGTRSDAVLRAGEQWVNDAEMGKVPVREEIAWSGDLDKHLALLGEVQVLRERWNAVAMPGLRYDSPLLRLAPQATHLFASLPNYGEALGEAHRLFEERLQESAVLREFWARADPAKDGGPSLATAIAKVRSFAGHLGDEVALAIVEGGAEGPGFVPLMIAEVRQPGLREFIEDELARVPEKDKGPRVHVVDGAAAYPARGKGDALYVLVRNDVMAVSIDPAVLAALVNRIESSGPGLASTPFGEKIAAAYGDGVGLLFAADLERMTAQTAARAKDARETFQRTGLDSLRSFILERKAVGAATETRALLAFQGEARGIPSWLAAPAPIGSLEFVSPTAQAVAAFVAKSPALIFDDMMAIAGGGPGHAENGLRRLEKEVDLRLRQDIAETLGSDFTVALDGPILPVPSWKLVAEVYDPGRLQSSIQTLVGRANQEAARRNHAGVTLAAEQVGSHTHYSIAGAEVPFELHWAYVDGYLVAGPSRALVMRSIQTRASGDTLARSRSFRALFPADREMNVSALAYQNFGPMLRSLADAADGVTLSDDQKRTVASLMSTARPTLAVAYGEPGGIRVSGVGGLFDLSAADLTLPALLQRLVPRVLDSGTAKAKAS